MKKTIISLIAAAILSLSIAGCKCVNCVKDSKPVAPDTYSNEQGDVKDPVLPQMEFWWE
jgi:hypothetical protein